jgi:hypothetical protein
MNIGFFADDTSASQAAFLAGSGFNCRHRGPSGVLAGSNALADAVPEYLDTARELGRHLMVALPLAQLRNDQTRSRLDLAVVTVGPSLPARHSAFRAVAADRPAQVAGMTPPWLLAASGGSLPDQSRTLPVRMDALRSHEAADIRDGRTCCTLHRRAVGLAAALRIAAYDPDAPCLDAAEVARLLSADDSFEPLTEAEMLLRDDLRDLAAELACGPHGRREPTVDRRRLAGTDRRPGRRGLRHPVRGQRRPALPSAASLHATDCPRSVLV